MEQILKETCIADNDLIILETKKKSSKEENWLFLHDDISCTGKCENCYKRKVLSFKCKCKKAMYCCQNCLE